MERQSETGGFFSVKDVAPTTVNSGDAWKRQEEEEKAEEKAELDEKYGLTAQLKHQSIAARHLATGCLTPLPLLPIPIRLFILRRHHRPLGFPLQSFISNID